MFILLPEILRLGIYYPHSGTTCLLASAIHFTRLVIHIFLNSCSNR